MSGREGLRYIQLGREATAGTAVAATTIWRGRGIFQPDKQIVVPEEDLGIFGGLDRSYIPYVGPGFKMDPTPATFEQLPHILDAAIGEATPAADGDGSGYVYTYTLAETSEATPQTYTIEGGDDTQCEEMEYSIVSEFNINGASKEAVMVDATWFGRQLSKVTKTASLEPPTSIDTILFGKATLAIDAIDGTAGTTNKANSLMGFKLNVKTGFMPLYSADGNIYLATYYQTDPEATLELTMLHNTIGRAQIDAMEAQTPQLFEILVQGAALATDDTYTYKTLKITCSGKYESQPELSAQDGNNIITLKVLCKQSLAADNFSDKRLQIVVVNELSEMP